MAEEGRTWLVRRAERRYGCRPGRLRSSGLSRHVSALSPEKAARNDQPRFFTFGTEESPVGLVRAMEQAMSESGLPPAAGASDSALPPVPVSNVTRLD